MEQRNQKIIQAIIEKANRCCPNSLALIGIYGSFLTGDTHEKSDLDLLILINDQDGYQLSSTFIQEDLQIGHDLYCTTWEMLEEDAKFMHPHISKLMESKIVYCADQKYLTKLENLRKQAQEAETQAAAKQALKEAEHSYGLAMLANGLSDVRVHAGFVIHHAMNAIALRNHRYFRLGTKRVFEEIETMEHKPKQLRSLVDEIISAESTQEMTQSLCALLITVQQLFEKTSPVPEAFPGTYEEMFSNWRNKMYLAADAGDRYLAFSSMCSLNVMLNELGYSYDVLSGFDQNNLRKSAELFDQILEQYRKEYDKSGIAVRSYHSIDQFAKDY